MPMTRFDRSSRAVPKKDFHIGIIVRHDLSLVREIGEISASSTSEFDWLKEVLKSHTKELKDVRRLL